MSTIKATEKQVEDARNWIHGNVAWSREEGHEIDPADLAQLVAETEAPLRVDLDTACRLLAEARNFMGLLDGQARRGGPLRQSLDEIDTFLVDQRAKRAPYTPPEGFAETLACVSCSKTPRACTCNGCKFPACGPACERRDCPAVKRAGDR